VVNPKTQAKKSEAQAEEKAAKPEEETKKSGARAEAEQPPVRPLDEVLGQAQKAYSAYQEAEREVARMYRRNEQPRITTTKLSVYRRNPLKKEERRPLRFVRKP